MFVLFFSIADKQLTYRKSLVALSRNTHDVGQGIQKEHQVSSKETANVNRPIDHTRRTEVEVCSQSRRLSARDNQIVCRSRKKKHKH